MADFTIQPSCSWHGVKNCEPIPDGRPRKSHPGFDWRTARCFTCGAAPTQPYPDGSPAFSCPSHGVAPRQ